MGVEIRGKLWGKTVRRARNVLRERLKEVTQGELGLRVAVWRGHVAEAGTELSKDCEGTSVPAPSAPSSLQPSSR